LARLRGTIPPVRRCCSGLRFITVREARGGPWPSVMTAPLPVYPPKPVPG